MNNDYTFVFEEFIPDFFHFMLKEGGLARKTSRDYISRLKFLSDHSLATNWVPSQTLFLKS